MPVRALNQFLKDKSKADSIRLLAKTTVGIDAYAWLKRITPKEWAVPFIGGIPATLFSVIDTEIGRFTSAEIRPVFVFAGITAASRELASELRDAASESRSLAWKLMYGNEDSKTEAKNRARSSSTVTGEMINAVISHLRARDVAVIRAPYSALHQLALLHKQNFFSAIMGGGELLLALGAVGFPMGNLVLDIDWERQKVEWLQYATLLGDLKMPHEQFLDACLLAGLDGATFAGLQQPSFKFAARPVPFALAIPPTGDRVSQAPGPNKNETWAQAVLKGRAMMQHQMVLERHCCAP
ncbi:putative xpg i-region protein [Paratrimastix pyriformis]|uniref:Xpg i-region protein n=1 Tax=Paratrimastix pyriformis TaxID=342808 RepID=A0ABQ8UIS4_9EUKA|nr:putative xpg i-region protein [Paratrimastix pyriformis]